MNLFDPKNTMPNKWSHFTDVGSRIGGRLLMESFERDGEYGMQRIYPIEVDFVEGITNGKEGEPVEVGDLCNVGFPVTRDSIHNRVGGCAVGAQIGFEFSATKPAKKKGFQDAKIFKVYVDPADARAPSGGAASYAGSSDSVDDDGDAPF